MAATKKAMQGMVHALTQFQRESFDELRKSFEKHLYKPNFTKEQALEAFDRAVAECNKE
jgi:hypothetical protein